MEEKRIENAQGEPFYTLCFLFLRHWHLVAFLSLLFVQLNIYEVNGRSINAYHFFLVVCVFLYVVNFLLRPHRPSQFAICGTVFFVASLVPILLFKWGFSFDVLLLAMGISYLLVGVYMGKLSLNDRYAIYGCILWVFLFCTFIRALFNIDNLHLIYSSTKSAQSLCFSSGGKNIEATMFAVLCLLYRGRYGLIVGGILTLTCIMFESRIGLLGCLFYWFKLFFVKNGKRSYLPLLCGLACGVLLSVTSIFTNAFSDLFRFSLERELQYYDEGVGRLSLWESSIGAILQEPLGVGPGMAVGYINKNFHMSYWENNIHNIYLSWVLELGWVHGSVLVFSFLYLFCCPRLYSSGAISINEYILCLYLVVGGFIQYTGYDAVLLVFLGLNLSKHFGNVKSGFFYILFRRYGIGGL
jgi:hypothetical protein